MKSTIWRVMLKTTQGSRVVECRADSPDAAERIAERIIARKNVRLVVLDAVTLPLN